jgi:hypothetical protein
MARPFPTSHLPPTSRFSVFSGSRLMLLVEVGVSLNTGPTVPASTEALKAVPKLA